jgi:hypothetical protein
VNGALQLHPGRERGRITGGRPELASRTAVGALADELPQRLGALFALCAMPHRLAASRAVDAALGRAPAADMAQALRLSQAREQILRIAHDWPRLLPGAPACIDAPLQLRACPLWRSELDAAAQLAALPAWLEHKWLGMAPAAWLRHHEQDPAGWARRWCKGAAGIAAAVLHSQCRDDAPRTPGATALTLLAETDTHMPRLARQMLAEPGFCSRPHWQGAVPDTGPWSRAADPLPPQGQGTWPRLQSRLVDLLRLAAPGGERWLAQGALPVGANTGVAWVEMARGLLVHAVQLEPGAAGPRVAACRVLAPTEWNFHPEGTLARALGELQGAGAADAARRLAVAYDPCVEFSVHAPAQEAAH